MNEFRTWQAEAWVWHEIGGQLDIDGRCQDLSGRIADDSLATTHDKELLQYQIPLDDCAYLRELIGDLGLEGEMEDVTP
jgi:hypothetical protein